MIRGTEGFRYIDIPPQTEWAGEVVLAFYNFLTNIANKNISDGLHVYVPHLYHDGHSILAFHERTVSISYVEEGGVAHGLNNNVETQLMPLDFKLLSSLTKKHGKGVLIKSNPDNSQYEALINSQKCKGYPFFLSCSRHKFSFFVCRAAFREHEKRYRVEPLNYIKPQHKHIAASLSIFYMPSLKFSQKLRFSGIDWMHGLQDAMEVENILEDNLVVKLHGDTPLDIRNEFAKKFPRSLKYEKLQLDMGSSFYVDEASVLSWKNAIFAYRTSAIRYTKAFSPTTRILFSNSIVE